MTSKSFTSPAICAAIELASNWVILVMPDFPATIFCQTVGIPIPTGEIIPSPVMTTLRLDKLTPPNSKDGKTGKEGKNNEGVDYF